LVIVELTEPKLRLVLLNDIAGGVSGVVKETSSPYDVPAEFVAYALR